MVFCGKCGTRNPEGNQFCEGCGSRLNNRVGTPVKERETADVPKETVIRIGTTKKGTRNAIVAMVLIAIVVLAAFTVAFNPSEKDTGLKSYYDIEPLDGTFTLKGSATTDDKMVTYSGTATFVFDDGKLVDKWMDIQKTEYPDNGVTLKPNTIPRVDRPEDYKTVPVPMPGYMGYYDSVRMINPFLSDMDETGTCRTIYYQGGSLEGQGFRDSNGDKFFISDDGRLVSYCNTDYSVPIYFNLI